MRTFTLVLISIILSSCITKVDVDLVVHNAVIHTVNEAFEDKEAMAILGDSIVEIGPEHQIMNKYSGKKTIDARKQHIYPGFIDAHSHFLGYAKNLNKVDLLECQDETELFNRVNDFSKNIKGDWIEGRGWDQNLWSSNEFPNKLWLDENLGNKYVVLKRVDGHAALVNQKTLDLAGIDENTIVEGGKVEVKDGKCTGILIDNAVDLVTKIIPDMSDENLMELAIQAQQNCFEKGLTSVCDAGLDLDDVKRLLNWSENGELNLKFYIMLNPSEENFNEYLNQPPYITDKLSIRSFKIYADGALGSRGASLLESYSDDAEEENHGLILTPFDSIVSYASKIHRAGYQMNTHAIGDSANRMMLKIYSDQLKGNNDHRWRIEHAQVVNPNDLEKFKYFNIIPSVQPTHATSDMNWAIDRLGEERIDHAYAYKSLKEQNGLIALGTDFPVEKIDPLLTLLSAVQRTDLDGNPEAGYYMEEALSFEDCIRGMTIWAAIANFEENKKGSLENGKNADFVIFNNDLKYLNASNFVDYNVMATYINGQSVYEKAP